MRLIFWRTLIVIPFNNYWWDIHIQSIFIFMWSYKCVWSKTATAYKTTTFSIKFCCFPSFMLFGLKEHHTQEWKKKKHHHLLNTHTYSIYTLHNRLYVCVFRFFVFSCWSLHLCAHFFFRCFLLFLVECIKSDWAIKWRWKRLVLRCEWKFYGQVYFIWGIKLLPCHTCMFALLFNKFVVYNIICLLFE